MNNVATVVDSCSSDDSPNCEITQQNSMSSHVQLRRSVCDDDTSVLQLNIPSKLFLVVSFIVEYFEQVNDRAFFHCVTLYSEIYSDKFIKC